MVITLDELHQMLVAGEADEFDLDMIQAALDYRRKQIGIPVKGVSKPSEETGLFRVQFNAKASPRYLQGIQGTVIKENPKTYVVNVDENPAARRFSGAKNVRASKVILDKIA